jgi:hypothetical protein
MTADGGTPPRAFVRAMPKGANGIPDNGREVDGMFEAFGDVSSGAHYHGMEDCRESTAPRSSDYVGWIAAGAVAVGIVGAVVGCMGRHSRERNVLERGPITTPDPHDVTPPHGDKLLARK